MKEEICAFRDAIIAACNMSENNYVIDIGNTVAYKMAGREHPFNLYHDTSYHIYMDNGYKYCDAIEKYVSEAMKKHGQYEVKCMCFWADTPATARVNQRNVDQCHLFITMYWGDESNN